MSRLTPPTRLPTRAAPTPPQGSTPCGVRWRTCGSLRMLRRRWLTCSARCACMHASKQASRPGGQTAGRPCVGGPAHAHVPSRQQNQCAPHQTARSASPWTPPPGQVRGSWWRGSRRSALRRGRLADRAEGAAGAACLEQGCGRVGGRALGAAGILFVATCIESCKIAVQPIGRHGLSGWGPQAQQQCSNLRNSESSSDHGPNCLLRLLLLTRLMVLRSPAACKAAPGLEPRTTSRSMNVESQQIAYNGAAACAPSSPQTPTSAACMRKMERHDVQGWADLSDSTLRAIFTAVPPLHRRALAAVCRKWARVCQQSSELWEHVQVGRASHQC